MKLNGIFKQNLIKLNKTGVTTSSQFLTIMVIIILLIYSVTKFLNKCNTVGGILIKLLFSNKSICILPTAVCKNVFNSI